VLVAQSSRVLMYILCVGPAGQGGFGGLGGVLRGLAGLVGCVGGLAGLGGVEALLARVVCVEALLAWRCVYFITPVILNPYTFSISLKLDWVQCDKATCV
jgi:hypothetical protein